MRKCNLCGGEKGFHNENCNHQEITGAPLSCSAPSTGSVDWFFEAFNAWIAAIDDLTEDEAKLMEMGFGFAVSLAAKSGLLKPNENGDSSQETTKEIKS